MYFLSKKHLLFKNKTTPSQRRSYPQTLYTTMVTWLHIGNFYTSAADPGSLVSYPSVNQILLVEDKVALEIPFWGNFFRKGANKLKATERKAQLLKEGLTLRHYTLPWLHGYTSAIFTESDPKECTTRECQCHY